MAQNRIRIGDVSALDRHRSPSASEIYSSARKYLKSDIPLGVVSDGGNEAKERMPPMPRVTPVIGGGHVSDVVSPDAKPAPRNNNKARDKLITPVRIRSKSSDVNSDMYDNTSSVLELERSRTDTSLLQGIAANSTSPSIVSHLSYTTPPSTHHGTKTVLPLSSHHDGCLSDASEDSASVPLREVGGVKTVLFSSSKPHRSSAPLPTTTAATILPATNVPMHTTSSHVKSSSSSSGCRSISEQPHFPEHSLPSKPIEGASSSRNRQRRNSKKHANGSDLEAPPPPPSSVTTSSGINASGALTKDPRQTPEMPHRNISSSSSNSGRMLPGLSSSGGENKGFASQVDSKSGVPQMVVNSESAARGNDVILQQKLQEAKALNRRDDKGAIMFKFSLWGGGGGVDVASEDKAPSSAGNKVTSDKDVTSSVAPPKKSIKLRGPRAARQIHEESMESAHPQEKLVPLDFGQETASPPKPPPDTDTVGGKSSQKSLQQHQRSNMANAFRSMVVSCKQNQSSVGSNTDASIKTEVGVVVHRSLSRVNSEESLYSLEDETSQALVVPCEYEDEEKSIASVVEDECPDITVDSDVLAAAVGSLVLSEISRDKDATPVKYHSSSSFDRYSSFTNSGCNTPIRSLGSSQHKQKLTPPRTVSNRSVDDALSVFSGISEPFQSLALAPGVAHMKDWKFSQGESHDSVDGHGVSPCLSELSEHDDRFHRHRNETSSGKGNEEVYINDDTHGLVIHWKKGQVIGEGTFGQVYKGMNNATGELLAIKQICLADGTEDEVALLRREINVMQDLKHNNIVRYVGTTLSDRFLYILLEFVPGGSVASMLVQFGAFSEPLIRRLVYQILSGVEYLHRKGIIHRDIKGANVLVTDVGVAKLADFGCSKQLSGLCTTSLEESLKMIRGSVPWMAPEVIRQTGHGRSADIWSLGATIIEMATAKHPWPEFSNNMAALFHVATSRDPPPVPAVLSAPCADLLKRCMVIDSKKQGIRS